MFDIMAIVAFYPDVSWFGHERLLHVPLFKQMLLMTDYIPMQIMNIKNTRNMIKKLNLLQRFRILSMVPRGTHIADKKVDYYQIEKITVDFGEKFPFM